MKKTYQAAILSLGLITLSASPIVKNTSLVSTAYAAKILEVGVDTSNVPYKESQVTLRQNQALKNETLEQIKSIRSKMWDENILYTYEDDNTKATRLQDVAKSQGYTSKEAYVNALKWSSDLERIAIQRAYEQIHTGLSHTRPDGTSNESIRTFDGVKSNGENLAASTDTQSPARAIGQWSFTPAKNKNGKSEYDFIKESKGVFNANNGHLHLILDPEFKFVGFAEMNNDSQWNYSVAEFGFKNQGSTDPTGYVGPYRLYVGDPSTKSKQQPTTDEDAIEGLRQAVKQAENTIAGARQLMKVMPKFSAQNGDKLNRLIAEAEELIREASAYLN